MATVASQIVVELRANVEQHDKALTKSAETAKASMAKVEGAVDKAADATKKASEDAAKAAEKGAQRQQAAAKQKAAAEKASAEAITAAAEKTEAAAEKAAVATERSAQRVAAAGRRAAGASGGRGGAGGVGNAANQFQDLIVQVSGGADFLRAFSQQAPQLLSGFGAWGSVLGVAAAGVGVLAASLGGFETAADRAKTAQSSFDAALKSSEGAMTDQEKKAAEYARSLSLVEAGYLSLAKTSVEAGIRDQAKELEKNAEKTTEALGKVQSAINAYHLSLVNATTGEVLKDKPFTDFYAKVKPILDRLAQPGLSTREYSDLNQQLAALQSTAKTFGVDLQGLIDGNARSGQAALEHAAKLKELADIDARLNDLMGIGASVLRALGLTFETASGQVVTLTNAAAGFIGKLQQMISLSGTAAGAVNGVVANLRQQAEQMGDTVKSQQDYADRQKAVTAGQQAWAEAIKETGNPILALGKYQEALNLQLGITRREREAADKGKTTAADDLANLKAEAAALNGTKEAQRKVAAEQRARTAANAAYSKALAETGDETQAAKIKSETYAAQLEIETKNQQASAGAAKVSAAAKRELRSETALDKLQDEIALNEKLIAVHRQGPEAIARERAAFDALSSARQLGYKTDTEANRRAHDAYVQRYQDLAEQKRQQDVVLADYGKADSLTKSVMTSQEKYSATLAEYNRLRENGTLQEEAYLRLVRDLNAENSGYVEGIQAIGQAIQGGIQGATSFSDALLKIGISLAQLIAQAALFGSGPLGKLFDSLLGTSGGIFNLTGAIGASLGPGSGASSSAISAATSAVGLIAGRASGGQALPGKVYEVGENGREWFAPQVPGQVIPNSAIKAAAGGGGGGGPPIQFNISLAGANGDRAIAEIAAAAVKRGLAQVPEINRQHRIRFSST